MKQMSVKRKYAGSYFVSTGAQRSESCGFYVRLNSVNNTANPATGIFDVGISTTSFKWQVVFVAQLRRSMHLMLTWKADLGMDIYVDGRCAGSQIDGIPRDPTPTCGADDPFRNLFIGRRNDMSEGYSNAKIGRLNFYVSWQKPSDIYQDEIEGKVIS